MTDKNQPANRRDPKDLDIDPTTGMPNPTPKTGTNQSTETDPNQGHRTSRESTGPTGTTGGSSSEKP